MPKDYICSTCFHYYACNGVDAEARMYDIEKEEDCDQYLRAFGDIKNSGVLVVSWDFTKGGDHDCLTVGQFEDHTITIVNQIWEENAHNLVKCLIHNKE